MRAHKYAELFPVMEDDQLQELADDIKVNGLRAKIITLEDKVLDGRNRERACRMAGIEAVYKEYTGKDPLGYVISQNMRRRHLSVKARAEIAVKIANMRSGERTDLAPNGARLSQTAAAAKVGVSRRSVQRAAAKSKPAKSSRKREAKSWTVEDLKEDTELYDAFTAIATIYGNEDTKLIRTGTVGLKRADIIYLAKLPKEKMVEIQDLLFETKWTPQHAVKFVNDTLDLDDPIEHLINHCLATKGKFWSGDFGNFTVTCKGNKAAKR